MNVLVPLVGALALSLSVGSYLMRSHKGLTLVAASGVGVWAAYFALQGFATASVMALLMAGRVAAGAYVVHYAASTRWLLTLLVWLLTLASAWWTWQGWVSVPSTAATLMLAWAGFHLSYRPLRRALVVGELLLFANGWVTGSLLAMAAAALGLAMNLQVIARERRAEDAA